MKRNDGAQTHAAVARQGDEPRRREIKRKENKGPGSAAASPCTPCIMHACGAERRAT